MTPQALIDALIAAGTPTQLVIEVARILERLEVDTKRREASRQSSKRYRDKKINKPNGQVTSRQITSDHVMSPDANLPLKERSPPAPPSKENTPPVPPAADASVARDVRRDLFSQGLTKLAEMTGKTPDSCRSIVGKWLKMVDDEAIHVLGAIEDAHRNRVADPVPWIWTALNGHQKPNGYSHAKPARKTVHDVFRELAERPGDEPGPDDDRLLPFG